MNKVTVFFMMLIVSMLIAVPVSAQTVDQLMDEVRMLELERDEAEQKASAAARQADYAARQAENAKQSTNSVSAQIRDQLIEVANIKELEKHEAGEKARVARQKAMVASLTLQAAVKKAAEPVFKVYELKHQKAADIAKLMGGLIPQNASSSSMSFSSEFNTISLSAAPQVQEIAASIIQKYDVPKRTVEFQFFLVCVGEPNDDKQKEGFKTDGLPENVLTALKDMAHLTLYKSFELMGAPRVLVLEGTSAELSGQGTGNIALYRIVIGEMRIGEEANRRHIRINPFRVEMITLPPPGNPAQPVIGPVVGTSQTFEINTALEFTEGETTIIGGLYVQGNNAPSAEIIIVITAKIL